MMITQGVKKEQLIDRLEQKNADAVLEYQIVHGTNCSPFESQIIIEKAKEAFGVGQYKEGRVLADGQIVFHAVAADAPAGVPISQCRRVKVVLTLISRPEDLEVWREHGAANRRRQQLVRIAEEAKEQDALLTQEDLALLLGCDVRTIRSDIQVLRKQEVTVPTRGTVCDIGPGVSHKQQAILLWLEGKEPLHVARHLHHSLHAVERYIQTFCRVVYVQRQVRNILETSLIVGLSVSAAHVYWDLYSELVDLDHTYPERMTEIERIGQAHWRVADGKKKPLLNKRAEQEREQP